MRVVTATPEGFIGSSIFSSLVDKCKYTDPRPILVEGTIVLKDNRTSSIEYAVVANIMHK